MGDIGVPGEPFICDPLEEPAELPVTAPATTPDREAVPA